ncbi:uncharacterized protein BDW43DRAFT_86944 [Aspergillus alliaceus]|uniref:uncharacterized protein n=1 Tax=Petromyces alliaceus TaxID=209559 RepID=UPI0012A552BB|nr:uncharacterized protein BDW43DRAFT_86944 [Aspergillus alliaceus]KAB8233412.1 hypothetical protein BDW43DRAFT_86944 [Aspergillus alliaceus]
MGKHTAQTSQQLPTLNETIDFIEQTYKESKLIIVGCLASWALCRLHFRFVWLLLILAICRTQYQVSIRRVERAIRDELHRYHAQKILQHGESVEWVNSVLGQVWHLYQNRIADQIVKYINAGLAQRSDDSSAQKVIIHSLAFVEQPIRFTKVITYSKAHSRNFIFEGHFQVDLKQPYDHRMHMLERHGEVLIDMAIVHEKPDRKNHDLIVHVKQFTGTGMLRLEIDLESLEPHILQPQIELQDHPQIDCTIRTVSQHHFPFHFAHHVDWRKVVEKQIREGLGLAFYRPLPLPFQFVGEKFLVKMMTWWWQLNRAYHD